MKETLQHIEVPCRILILLGLAYVPVTVSGIVFLSARPLSYPLCCAQQTGMHILVVEALLIAIYSTGDEQILIHKRKPCRSRTCLVRIAGPCPAVPVQLVPAQLGLSPAGPYQLWCTSLRIATDTRPTRNNFLRRTTAMARKKVIGDELSARAKENGFEPWRGFSVWSTTNTLPSNITYLLFRPT